ncbi:MAG: ribosome small subunit-dependent GTPase A, partial [Gammaproteobacteria bacterium]
TSGVNDLFADIHDLSMQCRFNDCQHQTEPGCAIQAAVETGTIDSARLKRWEKLVAEERYNSTNLAERKSNDKSLGKKIRSIKKGNRKND